MEQPDRDGGTFMAVARVADSLKTERRDRTLLTNRAAPLRHFDASARVSLADCVPAGPASVSPRAVNMPQLSCGVTQLLSRPVTEPGGCLLPPIVASV